MNFAKQSLAARRQQVSDVVTGLVQRSYLGALLFGPGGDGKTHEVISNLNRHGVFFGLANSCLSALGLYQFLERHKNAVCVIEDAESILRNRNALGVLRSATEGCETGRDGAKLRKITFHTSGKLREFVFTGAVILTMNRGLSDLPEAEALATRLQIIDYSLDEAEMIELMYEICDVSDQESRLSREERRQVTEFVIDCARRGSHRLNLRMQSFAFDAYAQWDLGAAGLHWQDTIDSQIHRRNIAARPIVIAQTRAKQISSERQILRSILHMSPKERLAAWEQQTGKSRAAMYRRLSELGELDASHFDPSLDGPQARGLQTDASQIANLDDEHLR